MRIVIIKAIPTCVFIDQPFCFQDDHRGKRDPKIPINDDQVSAATHRATTLNLPCQATCHSIQQSAEESERFAS